MSIQIIREQIRTEFQKMFDMIWKAQIESLVCRMNKIEKQFENYLKLDKKISDDNDKKLNDFETLLREIRQYQIDTYNEYKILNERVEKVCH